MKNSEDDFIEADGERFTTQPSQGRPPRKKHSRERYPAQAAFEQLPVTKEMFIPLREDTTLRDLLAGHQSFWSGKFKTIADHQGIRSYTRFDWENGGVWFGKEEPKA